MRKLYVLLAGFAFFFVTPYTHARPFSPDIANFTFTIDASTHNVVFTNTSTIGSEPGIRRAFWSFGDGSGQWTGALDGTQHHYQSAGTYTVCLKIYRYFNNTSDSALSAQICKTLVIESACQANFEYRDSIISVNPLVHLVRFHAIPHHIANKPVTQVCWDFGDGTDTCINITPNTTPINQLVVQHRYYQPGPFNVCVKIKYLDGCVADKCKPVLFQNADSCRADFERIPVTATNNTLTAAFRALPWHNKDKKPARICWSFGDNRDTCINYGQDYNGPYIVNHTYQQPGQYEVCVKILYYGGCEARKCKPVALPHAACSVRLFEITPSVTSLSRVLYASVSSVPNRRVERICWYFGDGTDTCVVPTSSNMLSLLMHHTYPGPGVYRACVKVLFEGGCIASDCKEIVIRGRHHQCGGFMTDSLIAPRTIKFKGFAIHNPNDQVVGYRWSFGDGSTATGREVTHTYNVAGEYRVCLGILTQSGCETKICNTVRVPGPNHAILQLSPNPVVNVLHALFLSTHNETVTIRIINSNGVVVRTFTRYATIGANNWNFDAANLLPGTYLFTVQSPNQLASALFVKQ